ncbi:MAG: hypothetical protein A2Z29_00290 [Chloroflexi bacterium RBG_16_56_11]|nr:MAG: hypothetical protein A2Z29_00290 [Chloroflexi bacterium RBG_16_56_11]
MSTPQTRVNTPDRRVAAKRVKAATVLVIEDEEDIRNFAARVLELEDYDVIKAADASSGMQMLKEKSIDLVLLDLRLPDLDGWSILREIKHHPDYSRIPVIVFTALAEAMQRRKTLRMGAASYLIKPLSARLLSQTVTNILRETGHRAAAGYPQRAWKTEDARRGGIGGGPVSPAAKRTP